MRKFGKSNSILVRVIRFHSEPGSPSDPYCIRGAVRLAMGSLTALPRLEGAALLALFLALYF